MIVTHDNYAEFLLDFVEGRLTSEQSEALMRFLDANPVCKKELEEFENISVGEADVVFEDKQSLKRRTHLLDEEFFDLTEGNVHAADKEELLKIISGNAPQEKELRIWNASRVNADLSVAYPDKEELKRPVIVPLWSSTFIRAAAAILILAGSSLAYFMLSFNPHTAEAVLVSSSRLSVFRSVSGQQQRQDISSVSKDKAPLIVNRNEEKQNKLVQNNFVSSANTGDISKNDTAQIAVQSLNNQNSASADSVQTQDKITKESRPAEEHGVWGPEEEVTEHKITFKRRMLEFAVSCINGLKKIGVKKADAVKKADPETGEVEYILVLGKRGIITKAE